MQSFLMFKNKNMTQQLKTDLEIYLGALIYDLSVAFDWLEKKQINDKIRATEILLGLN